MMRTAIAAIALAVVAGLTGCSGHTATHRVTLWAGSDGGSLNSVTYGNVGSSTSQNTTPPDPWSVTAHFAAVPDVSLVVQNGGAGRVWCTIRVDGQVADSEASQGPYAVVTCES